MIIIGYLEKELDQWADFMLGVHLPRWNELPEFDIYMDQVVTIVNHSVTFLQLGKDDKLLTPSMVNNYVKLNLMPKPQKKRYTRIHIAYLIIIMLLKPVLSISDIRDGIVLQVAALNGSHHAAYNLFCKQSEKSLHAIASFAKGNPQEHPYLGHLPLNMRGIYMITYALASKLFAEKVLDIERENQFDPETLLPIIQNIKKEV